VSSLIERRRSGVCPDCDAPAVVPTADRGERVCEECGLVVADDEIDRGPEWRAYSHRESQAKSRVGAPATRTLHDKGLTTDIDWRDEDAAGTPLSDRQRERVSRLRQWHERVRTNEAGELALEPVDPAEYIPRFRSELGLSERVGRTASEVVGRTVAAGVLSGESPTGFAAGSIYVAALLCDEKRTQAAVADAAGVTTVTVRNRYQAQIDALGISADDGLSEGSRASLDAEGSPASSTPVVATETPPSSPSPPSPSSNDWRDSGGDSDDRDDDGSSGRDSDGSEDNDESNESDDSDEHRLSKP
jgi:transcription initiation factor TFIIIB Brf1 subunit/transcription initiation factor TFIIB